MLYLVIERFRDGDTKRLGGRFQQCGRMMPEGVVYHASWIDPVALRCFQIMESPQRELLDDWIAKWDDLVEFEVTPVLTSAEFWATQRP